MPTIIHVNCAPIVKNAQDGGERPVYKIKIGGRTRYAREVLIDGPSRLVYDGRRLSCGTRAWIETEPLIRLIDELSFAEAKACGGRRSHE